jgi:hypothetical protein
LPGSQYSGQPVRICIFLECDVNGRALYPDGVVAAGSQSHRKTFEVRLSYGQRRLLLHHAHNQEMWAVMVALKIPQSKLGIAQEDVAALNGASTVGLSLPGLPVERAPELPTSTPAW